MIFCNRNEGYNQVNLCYVAVIIRKYHFVYDLEEMYDFLLMKSESAKNSLL